jgi:hypothetical protein
MTDADAEPRSTDAVAPVDAASDTAAFCAAINNPSPSFCDDFGTSLRDWSLTLSGGGDVKLQSRRVRSAPSAVQVTVTGSEEADALLTRTLGSARIVDLTFGMFIAGADQAELSQSIVAIRRNDISREVRIRLTGELTEQLGNNYPTRAFLRPLPHGEWLTIRIIARFDTKKVNVTVTPNQSPQFSGEASLDATWNAGTVSMWLGLINVVGATEAFELYYDNIVVRLTDGP